MSTQDCAAGTIQCCFYAAFCAIIVFVIWSFASDHGTTDDLDPYDGFRSIICNSEDYCNDMIMDINNDTSIHLQCNINACSNLTLNGDNADEIEIHCSGDNACSDLIINAQYAETFNFICGNSSNFVACNNIIMNVEAADSVSVTCNQYGCTHINIYATEANQLEIIADGDKTLTHSNINAEDAGEIKITCKTLTNDYDYDYVCMDVNVSALQVNEINVNANGRKALINSNIYAQNASLLDVTCFSDFFGGETCLNTNVHLSSMRDSNTLNCRFGCDKIGLLFNNDLEVLHDITFKECSLCQNFDECGDEWNIYSRNNNTTLLADYINDKYLCPETSLQKQFENEFVVQISMGILLLYVSIIFILLIGVIIYSFILYYKKRIKYVYVSSAPSLLILLYSIGVELIIFTAMYWWGIKITIFYDATETYCSSKYTYEADKHYCVADKFCDYSTECGAMEPLRIITIVWWCMCGILLIYEVWIFIFRLYFDTHSKCLWPICDFFWFYMYCKLVYNEELYKKNYIKNEFWMDNKKRITIINYFLSQLISYGPLTLLTGIIVVLYCDYNTDYALKWYEYYPIFVLIISKIMLQIYYTFGPKYKSNREIEWILKHKFGKHIGYIIKQYTPLFYDKDVCSSEVIINETELKSILLG